MESQERVNSYPDMEKLVNQTPESERILLEPGCLEALGIVRMLGNDIELFAEVVEREEYYGHWLNTPDVVMLHVYTDPTTETSTGINDGLMVDYALIQWLEYLNSTGKGLDYNSLPTIFIAGGHSVTNGGKFICDVHKEFITSNVSHDLRRRLEIITESERTKNATDFALASDTRGEISFLSRMLGSSKRDNTAKVMCLGRLQHMPRITELVTQNLDSSKVKNVSFMSDGGIWGYFHPDQIINLCNDYLTSPDGVQFIKGENNKLLFMSLLDKNGELIEMISKVLGSDLKDRVLGKIQRTK